MKYKMLKLISFLMVVMLCGCSAPQTDQIQDEGNILQLVNPSPESPGLPYAVESPQINDMHAIANAGGEITFSNPQAEQAALTFSNGDSGELRAVWISYLEMETLLKSKTEKQFTNGIAEVFDNVKGFGLNTVIVQVRPFGDALYASDYFPWSYTITGTEGKAPGFDPLEIMVREAKSRNLRFDAWVNPYRVRAAGNTNALSSKNQAKAWLDAGDGAVIQYNGMISYNPASEKAQNHIIEGIREIIRNYDVDAVHIDDYFYPTTDAAFDQSFYNAYVQSGGTKTMEDWRRGNVETLVKGIYNAVKEEGRGVKFGISPQGNMDANYNGQYLDVKKIAANEGYCDYICPQVYFGFENDSQPFAQTVKSWNDLADSSSVELYIGIAAYKLGAEDNYAGMGKREWLDTTTQLKDMVMESRNLPAYAGFVLYRYDSIFRPAGSVASQVNTECENLKKIL